MASEKKYSYIAIVGAMMLWSVSFVWSKLAFESYNPFTVLFFRLFIAAISLFIVSKAFGLLQKIDKSDYKILLLLSFFEPFLYFIGENFGLQYVTASTAAIIISTIPLFMPFLGFIFFKERIRRNNLIGVFISFLGVLFVMLNKDLSIAGDIKGFVFLFVAVFAALGYTVVVKRITYKYNAFTIVIWQNIIASIVFFPLFLFFDFQAFKEIGFNSDFQYIVLLGIMASNGAFLLYTYAFKHFRVSQIGLFSNLIPIFTIVISFFVFSEKLETIKYFGIALVVGGLFISEFRKNRS
ncbi:MAG: hypothetical protein B6I18_00455 [Bacteroidetes bacterium 4572_112]|nr:MAG: hypothetical protein B6I18_00455 [Bacteroidetes bacterium 4572_112]